MKPPLLQCDRAFDGAEISYAFPLASSSPRLQCDRAFDGAEMSSRVSAAPGMKHLQCDRAFDGAEMSPIRRWIKDRVSFNVTARLMARKFAARATI
ncbi:MAG: hypothetical protein M2R45_00435 [Verrucomicrobia subdivision 3 bacterium]|nr:hypothetical protein [Limisphaerales bacterium]MCS1413685.1 hypothetical protein [Limisphaerales bacterium]